jgi:citrate synthase
VYFAKPGLEDVTIGRTEISQVGGETGQLSFRGYEIADVVAHLGYEGTVHLLVEGTLATDEPPAELVESLARRRSLPPELTASVDSFPRSLTGMDSLRAGVAVMNGPGFAAPPTKEQGLELIAKAPTLLARTTRRHSGLAPVEPDPKLGHVANYLYMLRGERPQPREVGALESYFDIVADHGMNASTFALRVVLSTGSDYVSAVTAAIGALKGPLHGGAPQRVLDMLDRVGSPEKAEGWVGEATARKERLMGFGHRAYKVEDPRAILLREIARGVATPDRFRLAQAVEEAALASLRRSHPEQRLFTNVEFYAAIVLEASGLPRELFPPTFALARTAGWAAHALEQISTNRLIRPDIDYAGPTGRTFPSSTPRRAGFDSHPT